MNRADRVEMAWAAQLDDIPGLRELPRELDSPGLRYFLDYVRYGTTSDENSESCPSTASQRKLAERLLADLKALGLRAEMDENGYVYGWLPASVSAKKGLTIGWIAHMDTSPELSGDGVCPRIQTYQGEPLALDAEGNYQLHESRFPNMAKLRGRHLVTTDGRTLLGADDKAGVAAIMGMLESYTSCPDLPHPALAVAFTPDEEIGRGAHRFDVSRFGADFAYTLDGGPLGELESECFNAAGAHIRFHGLSVHTGTAKNQMVNASLLARDFAMLFPDEETPQATEGREGFFHLCDMRGCVDEAELSYIIRDFEREGFEARKAKMEAAVTRFRERYGAEAVDFDMWEQYRNMGEILKDFPLPLDLARSAMRELGIEAIEQAIRGGTDGSQLSFKGLPCPNIFTGGENFHGRYEILCVESFNRLQDLLLTIGKRGASVESRG